MRAHANSLQGAEHIAALEKVLAILDPSAGEAQSLRAHIATDRAFGDSKPARLLSAYAPTHIKLMQIENGPSSKVGLGLKVQLTGRTPVPLLLDSGASGVAVSQAAVK